MNKKKWRQIARKEQLPPKKWHIWLILAGRGFGKTRAAAETVLERIEKKKAMKVGLLGGSFYEVKEIMLLGNSGILHNSTIAYNFIESSKKIEFENGAVCNLFSAHSIESLRGFEFDLFWIDELAKLPQAEKILEQVFMCLRKKDAKLIITTTAHENTRLLKNLMEKVGTYTTMGSSFDNPELSKVFFERAEQNPKKHEFFVNLTAEDHFLSEKDISYKESQSPFYFFCLGIGADLKKESAIFLLGLNEEGEIFILDDFSTEDLFDFCLKKIELLLKSDVFLAINIEGLSEISQKELFPKDLLINRFKSNPKEENIYFLLKIFYKKYKIFHSEKVKKSQKNIFSDEKKAKAIFLALIFFSQNGYLEYL